MRLLAETTDLLANAWVERGRVEHDDDVDPAMGFTRVACAVENELCAGLIPAVEGLRDRLRGAGDRRHAVLAALLDDVEPRDSNGRPAPWTLGKGIELLRRMAGHRRDLEALKLPALVKLATNLKWLEGVSKLRNPASHGGRPVGRAEVKRALFAFFEEKGVGLVPVVDAREEVKGAKV